MGFLPIQKAFSSQCSVYIFSCPHRRFPVVIGYPSLALLAEITHVTPILSLLDRAPSFFDSIECGCGDGGVMGGMAARGFTVSQITMMTDIHPLEIALYFSGVVAADEVTSKIILERTNNLDIPVEHCLYYRGEPLEALA